MTDIQHALDNPLLCGPWEETPGNDPNRVCRDLSVKIPNQDRRGTPTGGVVVPNPSIPTGTTSFRRAHEGWKVEHLSREEMVDIGQRAGRSLFFQAVHACFAEHYPLALSPEGLMYLVLHEVAVTVTKSPDRYRHLFTTSPDKQLIHVRHDGLRMGQRSPWHEVIGTLGQGLAAKVPAGLMDFALPGLSTHTIESRAASLVAFMDAASPYYDYRVSTRCGIPSIRLLGKPEDYQAVLDACIMLDSLFQEGLGNYFKHLLPVLRTLARQADPSAPVDNDFWKSIYKHQSGSGTDAMTGWITAFINYVTEDDKLVPKDGDLYDWAQLMNQGGWPRGVERGCIPEHINKVPFVWDYFGREMQMSFLGGFLGIEAVNGYITPRLGYGVVHAK